MNDDITGSTRTRDGFQFSKHARPYRSDRSWCAANSTELMWKYSGFSVAPSSGSYTPHCIRSRTSAGSRSDGSRSAIWWVSMSRTSQTVAVSVFIWCWQRELALGKELFHCAELSELKMTAGMWLGWSACPHGCWSDAASLLTRWGGLCNKSINQLLNHIAVLWESTYTDAAYCYQCKVVRRSVCHDCQHCKNGWTNRDAIWVVDTAEPKNHVLDGDPDPPDQRDNSAAKEAAHCKVHGVSAIRCEKTPEATEMLFGVWTWVSPRKRARWGCTLSPLAEYDWTMHVWWQCGLLTSCLLKSGGNTHQTGKEQNTQYREKTNKQEYN